jgi:hypothetical protein
MTVYFVSRLFLKFEIDDDIVQALQLQSGYKVDGSAKQEFA